MHGKFFWYDVMTTDVQAAGRFYSQVVGWEIQETAPGMNYSLFTIGGQGVAGLMPLPDAVKNMGAPPSWTGYIAVDDVDDMAERVTRAGGAVYHEPTDIPDVIHFAVVADPQGAQFVIATPLSTQPRLLPEPGTPGSFAWRELYADDATAAFSFYEKLFGWTKAEAIDMGPMGVYQLVKMGGENAEIGMMNKPDATPACFWSFYIETSAIDDAGARVVENGGKIVNGPMEVPGGQWILHCLDPEGAYFAMVASKR